MKVYVTRSDMTGAGFHLQIGFSVDVGGINRDVAQPSADGVDIYSGKQKMCGRRVVPIPHAE